MNRNLSQMPRAMLLFVCGGAAQLLEADTITFAQSFRLNPTNPGDTFAFAAFDPSLGSLTSVEVSFNATRRHEWGLWSIAGGDVPRTIDYQATLAGSTFTLNGVQLHFADVAYGPAVTAPLASVSDDDFAADFSAGYASFLAGNPAGFALGAAVSSLSTLSYSGTLPLSFDGDLLFDYDAGVAAMLAYNAGTWTVEGAENAQAASLVDVYGEAKVTYHYAKRVPDDLPVGWIAAVLVGICLAHGFGGRRSRRSPDIS